MARSCLEVPLVQYVMVRGVWCVSYVCDGAVLAQRGGVMVCGERCVVCGMWRWRWAAEVAVSAATFMILLW